jgi:hypothetical protein
MAHGNILSLVVLALCQPDAEGNLGRAEEAHQVWVLGEEAGDFADPCGAELPQE